MLKLLSEEVPGYVLHYTIAITAHTTALRGPSLPKRGNPGMADLWNIHACEFAR
jgi:hypothetical protein